MSISRRGFLGGLAGVLAAGVAPAFVKNPMKIVVPSKDIIRLNERFRFDSNGNLGVGTTDPAAKYYLQASRQDEFGEAFFPTVTLDFNEAGILVPSNKFVIDTTSGKERFRA